MTERDLGVAAGSGAVAGEAEPCLALWVVAGPGPALSAAGYYESGFIGGNQTPRQFGGCIPVLT